MRGVRSCLSVTLAPIVASLGCGSAASKPASAPAVAIQVAPPAPAAGQVRPADAVATAPSEPGPDPHADPAEERADEGAGNDDPQVAMAPASARGWLGVELEPPGTGEAGVRVARVVPSSPAEKAGLLAGDLIQQLDGDSVAAPGDVVAKVGSLTAGTRVAVTLKRLNADRLLSVTLGAAPSRDDILRMSFVDRPAPAFSGLATAKGTATPTLDANRGHVLVVEFWGPFCAGCRAMIPHMNQLHAQYGARGLRVLGITLEPVARALPAAAELGMDFPVASDVDGATARAYQARAIPMVFAIDRRGTVRDVMVGFDPARLPAFDRVVERLLAER